MPSVTRHDNVFVIGITDHDPEGRFNPEWIEQFNAALDEVEASSGPAALITTGAGKFYSTGADLRFGMANIDKVDWMIDQVHAVMLRLLRSELPTIALLNGHTFGGGAFFAMTHDRRIMRSDRGYFCFPGVTLGTHYAPAASDLMRAKMHPAVIAEAFLTGRRYGADEALSNRIVDEVVAEADLLDRALAYAQSIAQTRGPVLSRIRTELYREAISALAEPVGDFIRRDFFTS